MSVNPGEIHVTDRQYHNYKISIVDVHSFPRGAGGVPADQHTIEPPELVNFNGQWIKTYFEEKPAPAPPRGRVKKIAKDVDTGEWRGEYVRD